MPSLGLKKKENLSRIDRHTEDLPRLSNEMQLSIMNKVKSGELSIEDALNEARKDRTELLKQRSLAEEEQQPSQYNFSVHKHGRYRWQKRVLQIDFKTKMLCSIEKGIIKQQLPFTVVKSCDDGVGSRFSISFRGHQDYELEATSLEDKHKMIQLVNQIIYQNIYSDSEEGNAEACKQPQASQSLREGVLLLHRGGLASLKWVKYEVQLHPGQLTLVPIRRRGPADDEVTLSGPVSTVVHLSDGNTSVQKPNGSDTFTLVTHKNEYQFRVPVPDHTTAPGAVQQERDAWVEAIDKLCSDWKRKSRSEQAFVETKNLQQLCIAEDTEDTDLESSSEFGSGNMSHVCPPVDNTSGLSAGDEAQSSPSADKPKPAPKPRSAGKAAVQVMGPDVSPPVPSPTSPKVAALSSPASPQPSPAHTVLTSSSTVPESLPLESAPSNVKEPSPPGIPVPPPLPPKVNLKKPCTKAFHWDVVGSEKIAKSFWIQESTRRIEIDTSRLCEQFAVKDLGTSGVAELINTHHIMLNQKIAHNFNIFLKSFPVQPGELKDKLFIVNEEDGGLSDEHITSLRRYVPTMDDVEMYKSHKGPVSDLHIVDQYMLEVQFLSSSY